MRRVFKFGFIEEIQDTEIQDTRYGTDYAVTFFPILYLVSCNLYLAEKLQFEIQKYPPDHSTIYANFKKDFSPNILKDPFKYAIIV